MCKSTKEGGIRCGAHASATLAMEKQISKSTNAPMSVVKKILSRLRKQGRGNTAPTKSEVKDFAAQQKYIVQNDYNLNSHDKKILTNRWDRAENEEISGGTWHAIKNGYVAVMSFLKKKVVAGGLIGVMSFTSIAACSAGKSSSPEISQSPPNATSTVDPSASPAPTEEAVKPGTVDAGFATSNIMIGKKEDNGQFERNTLVAGDQSSLLKGIKMSDDLSSTYSDEEIAASNQVAAQFGVEQLMDSKSLLVTTKEEIISNYNDSSKIEYFSAGLSKELLSQDWNIEEIGTMYPSDIGEWRADTDMDNRPANGTYYDKAELKLVRGYRTADGLLGLEYGYTTRRSVVNADKTDKAKYDEYQKGFYSVAMDPKDVNNPKVEGFMAGIDARTVNKGEKPVWD